MKKKANKNKTFIFSASFIIFCGAAAVVLLNSALSDGTTESLTAMEHKGVAHTRILPAAPYLVMESNPIEAGHAAQVREKWAGTEIEPAQWGEQVTGVKNRMDTEEKVLALTLDACGGPYGSGYDEELIDFLREEEIPAVLFVNARWISENEAVFLELSEDDLFTIENHGTDHLPLSVSGGTAWGIKGTGGAEEVIDEVMENQELIYSLTGIWPAFFRSGTAYYDEAAVQIVNDLGLEAVNYDILGDAGATYTSSQVKESLLTAEPGSIALLHMNQPGGGTAEGVMEAVPLLQERGFEFVHLDDYELEE
ncbi:polysaccharide deacetylase family protein [Evansella clarkii]|uniref:polysaccharide deacetylase family protein n=1 Tax=Evansella clarkii TaxID=79879 RepID=UPI001EEE5B8B|nr:polysaccharide deacetylase family protein [Evansella clarkii]